MTHLYYWGRFWSHLGSIAYSRSLLKLVRNECKKLSLALLHFARPQMHLLPQSYTYSAHQLIQVCQLGYRYPLHSNYWLDYFRSYQRNCCWELGPQYHHWKIIDSCDYTFSCWEWVSRTDSIVGLVVVACRQWLKLYQKSEQWLYKLICICLRKLQAHLPVQIGAIAYHYYVIFELRKRSLETNPLWSWRRRLGRLAFEF